MIKLLESPDLFLDRKKIEILENQNYSLEELRKFTAFLTVNSISPIEEEGAQLIVNRLDLDMKIELPLLRAMRILYDKNIQTYMSGANGEEAFSQKEGASSFGTAYFTIPLNRLSENNLEIALSLGPSISTNIATIHRLVEGKSVVEIEEEFIAIANQFEDQPLTWGFVSNPEELNPESPTQNKECIEFIEKTKMDHTDLLSNYFEGKLFMSRELRSKFLNRIDII